jgi:hypothetical protein
MYNYRLKLMYVVCSQNCIELIVSLLLHELQELKTAQCVL